MRFNYDWDWPSAASGFQRAIELSPSYATAYQRYSLYLIAMGQARESLEPFYMALIYAGLGENVTARDWLEKAYADRSNGLVFLKVDPELDSLSFESALQGAPCQDAPFRMTPFHSWHSLSREICFLGFRLCLDWLG